MGSYMKYVGRTLRCYSYYKEASYYGDDLTGIRDSYLINICNNEGISQEKLSELLFVHKSNVARQLSFLEESGHIVRTPDSKDKRSLLVYSTLKGREALKKIKKVHEEFENELFKGFTDEEREEAKSFAQRIYENAAGAAEKIRKGVKED